LASKQARIFRVSLNLHTAVGTITGMSDSAAKAWVLKYMAAAVAASKIMMVLRRLPLHVLCEIL
jgi:hypothetical protein